MSHINHSSGFAQASGIQELGIDEIEDVNGGIPFVVAAALTFYGTEIAYGAGFVAGAAVAIYAYANG